MTGCSQSIWDITAPELKEAGGKAARNSSIVAVEPRSKLS